MSRVYSSDMKQVPPIHQRQTVS